MKPKKGEKLTIKKYDLSRLNVQTCLLSLQIVWPLITNHQPRTRSTTLSLALLFMNDTFNYKKIWSILWHCKNWPLCQKIVPVSFQWHISSFSPIAQVLHFCSQFKWNCQSIFPLFDCCGNLFHQIKFSLLPLFPLFSFMDKFHFSTFSFWSLVWNLVKFFFFCYFFTTLAMNTLFSSV